jgi:hypothetical protein
MIHPISMLHGPKQRRTTLAYLARITLHHTQIRTHSLGQINLVNHQQVTTRNPRPSLAWHLVAARNVDYVDDEIGELARVVCLEVVASRLTLQQIGVDFSLEGLQREQVGADVFAHGGVWASAGFDGLDALWGEGFVAGEEFGVFSVLYISLSSSSYSSSGRAKKKGQTG